MAIVTMFLAGCATTQEFQPDLNKSTDFDNTSVSTNEEPTSTDNDDTPPPLPWFLNSDIMEIDVNDSEIIARNIETGEEMVLITYTYTWTALDNGGFKMDIEFTNVSESVLRFGFFIHFAEFRDHQFGSTTDRFAYMMDSKVASFHFEDETPPHPIERFYIIQVMITNDANYKDLKLYQWYEGISATELVWENPIYASWDGHPLNW